jgi:hypothetical protein
MPARLWQRPMLKICPEKMEINDPKNRQPFSNIEPDEALMLLHFVGLTFVSRRRKLNLPRS